MFAVAEIPAATLNRSPRNQKMVTTWSSGLRNNRFATAKSRCGAGHPQDSINGRRPRNFLPHLATIVPAAAAHPPLDYPSLDNVGEAYDVQWFTFTSGKASQQNLFGDSKFWRTKFLDAYNKHIAFKTLDSSVGNPSVSFQRILKHPTADAYYDAMVPTVDQFKKITTPILTITGQYRWR